MLRSPWAALEAPVLMSAELIPWFLPALSPPAPCYKCGIGCHWLQHISHCI